MISRLFVTAAAVAIALLAGCGGSQTFNPSPTQVDPRALPHHKTSHYTGRPQSFLVPAGVKWITAVALGAAGAGSYSTSAGRGGRVYAQIPVSSGERLVVNVGGAASGASGGYNGGGDGWLNYSSIEGYGGGGASDVREGGNTLNDRILVVGGGGGQGGENDEKDGLGGGGGGVTGDDGTDGQGGRTEYGRYYVYGGGGSGGTQYAGGTGGQGGTGGYGDGRDGGSGSLGKGGAGGEGAGGSGGGAGGGYYGGGGGGGGWDYGDYNGGGGGGGGGSSYIEPKARKYESWKAWAQAKGDGLVVIGW